MPSQTGRKSPFFGTVRDIATQAGLAFFATFSIAITTVAAEVGNEGGTKSGTGADDGGVADTIVPREQSQREGCRGG